jgi:thaumarchaeosortase
LNASNALESAKRKALEAPYIVYFAALVLVAFLADPYSFTRSWNEGRSAMLAIVPLVFLEAGKGSFSRLHGRRKPLVAWLTLGVAAAFYFTVSQRFVVDSIVSFGGRSLGVDPTTLQFSWVWAIDYTATSVFLTSLLLLDRGSKTITPLIYTVGMASFLFIDVLLPENTLGPFGSVVPPVLQVVAGALNLFSPGAAGAQGNILTLQNSLGTMNLQVFWPSAGLHGIVIGLLVVLAICVKAGTGWARGGLYLALGIAGSFLVNVLRLALLAAYAMRNITDPKAFEAFHSVAGELIFIPWIIVFVILILRREGRISTRARLLTKPGI